MTSFLAVSNSFTSGIAKLFHPIVYAVAWMLAFIYGIIPNYAIAIAVLTVIIMALLTPLTVKSTRSMIAMQKLQPELKRIQQKYKGPEHRQELNEEMMRLYREAGVNPATGCITGLLQAPFLFILYSVIRGLSNTIPVVNGKLTESCPSAIPPVPSHYTGLVSCPKNIPATSDMFHALVHANPPGAMYVWHMDIALKAINSHSSFLAAVPFYVLIAVAVGVQYFQMSQLNRRNPNASQMSGQMLAFQRLTPILFAYIYFIVPAAAVIYMIFSSLIRILTQDLIFRYDKPKPPVERVLPAATEAAAPASDDDAKNDVTDGGRVTPKPGGPNGAPGANASSNGAKTARGATPPPKPAPSHPRSKDKRKRKAR
jgi:YidC/Oxa1 family membrane protein insertase